MHDKLPSEHDWLFTFLNKAIKLAICALAILMVLVIFWGLGNVINVLYQKLISPPFMLLEITDIFKTFATFLAVLILIEIYQNIVIYIRTNILPIKLVATLDLSITYYLMGLQHKKERIK